jgi:hypothetical protein
VLVQSSSSEPPCSKAVFPLATPARMAMAPTRSQDSSQPVQRSRAVSGHVVHPSRHIVRSPQDRRHGGRRPPPPATRPIPRNGRLSTHPRPFFSLAYVVMLRIKFQAPGGILRHRETSQTPRFPAEIKKYYSRRDGTCRGCAPHVIRVTTRQGNQHQRGVIAVAPRCARGRSRVADTPRWICFALVAAPRLPPLTARLGHPSRPCL